MDINGFFETDGDCMQHCKKVDDKCYHFVQVELLDSSDDGNDVYAICAGLIDLSRYTREDYEKAIYGFYESIEAMEKSYGLALGDEKLDQLIAECEFENTCLNGAYSIGGVYSWNEAEKKIKEYMQKY